MALLVEREYEEGWEAGHLGKDIDECPYDLGTNERIDWMLGYAAANLRKLAP